MYLLFDDLQYFHGADLSADTASDALGSSTTLGSDHDLHGAGFHALAAGGTELLIDHVHTGLGVLGDGASLTDLSALAALDADIGIGLTVLAGVDLYAAEGHIIGLIKCLGAGLDALQTGHALSALLNCKLLHK